MKAMIQLLCCLCGNVVERDNPDGYSLQVRKFGNDSPGMIWAHGPCLRRTIPVVAEGEKIPGPQGNVP